MNANKHITRMVGGILIGLLMSGCGKSDPNKAKSNQTQELSGLDKEALSLANDYWKAEKRGESFYLYQRAYYSTDMHPELNAEKTLHELRGANAGVHHDSLTEADKLNGIEWRGSVVLFAKAVRSYRLQPADAAWGQWTSGFGAEVGRVQVSCIDMVRAHGKWNLSCLCGFNGDIDIKNHEYYKIDWSKLSKLLDSGQSSPTLKDDSSAITPQQQGQTQAQTERIMTQILREMVSKAETDGKMHKLLAENGYNITFEKQPAPATSGTSIKKQMVDQKTPTPDEFRQVQARFQKMMMDLLQLAQTDNEAKAIVTKYGIAVTPPAK